MILTREKYDTAPAALRDPVTAGNMKFLPHMKYSIASHLSPADVMQVLKNHTEPRKLFRLSFRHKYFEGEINGNAFKINRIIHYRNSFLPVIVGEAQSRVPGSEVALTFRLNYFVMAFLALWFSGVIFGFIAVLPLLIQSIRSAEFHFHLLVPPIMLVFGYALTSAGFWIEYSRAKRTIDALLSQKEIR